MKRTKKEPCILKIYAAQQPGCQLKIKVKMQNLTPGWPQEAWGQMPRETPGKGGKLPFQMVLQLDLFQFTKSNSINLWKCWKANQKILLEEAQLKKRGKIDQK